MGVMKPVSLEVDATIHRDDSWRFAILWLLLSLAVILRVEHIVNVLAPLDGNFDDLRGRVSNLAQLHRTGNIYFPSGYEAFTYPPAAIAFFAPLTLISSAALPLVWTLLCVATLLGTYEVALTALTALRSHDRWAIALIATWLTITYDASVVRGLTWGQLALLIDLVIIIDVVRAGKRFEGVGIGLATAIKLYPALFIALYVWRRQWRAALNASATAVFTSLAATLLWPGSALYFFRHELLGGQEFAHFTANVPSEVNDSIIAVGERWPFAVHALPTVLTAVVLLAVLLLGSIAAQRCWQMGAPLTAMGLTLTTAVAALPLSRDHYFSFAPLLIASVIELGWRSPTTRAALVLVGVSLVPWFLYRHVDLSPQHGVLVPFIARSAIGVCAVALHAVVARTTRPVSDGITPSDTVNVP